MKLVLRFPDGWLLDEGARAATAPEGRIDLHDPMLLPDDLDAWLAGVLAADVPDGRLVHPEPTLDRATDLGWRAGVVTAAVVDAAGRACEHRVAVFYRFLHFVAAALFRSPDPPAAGVLDLLLSGRPDWRSDEPVALVELWEG